VPSAAPSAWTRARALADATPESRNRYADFLRAASIGVVVLGHWLMAAPSVSGGDFSMSDMLHAAPWAQWLTWAFQVMPLFFLVGGYSNAASWEAALRTGRGAYAAWLAGRLQRLVLPIVPLLAAWTGLALAAHQLGVSQDVIRIGSQVALIPTWFLAVYVMVVVVAPAMHWLWRRWAMASFWALVLGAVVIDAIGFTTDFAAVRWANYAFVWLAVHHLGFLWWDGRLAGARALPWALGGLAALVLLVTIGGYPVSMISVPGEEVSNSRPPTLALLALGAFHGGLVLSYEAAARRWLARTVPWTATVLVNGTIMTLYLWHATALVLVVGAAWALGGAGLGLAPGGAAWWATRPLWIAVLLAVLAPLVAAFGRFEQRNQRAGLPPPPAAQSVAGALAVCFALAALALGGVGTPGALGIRAGTLLLFFAGAALACGLRLGRRSPADNPLPSG
jgi:hypothetical protein